MAPVQRVRLLSVVLRQLVNHARLWALSTVIEPPIWLSNRSSGGAVGIVNPVSLKASSIDAVACEVFWMSRLDDSSLERVAVPGEFDVAAKPPTANTPSVAAPSNTAEPEAPVARVKSVAPPSRL